MTATHYSENEDSIKSLCGRFTLAGARDYATEFTSGAEIFNRHTTNNKKLVTCKRCLKKIEKIDGNKNGN